MSLIEFANGLKNNRGQLPQSDAISNTIETTGGLLEFANRLKVNPSYQPIPQTTFQPIQTQPVEQENPVSSFFNNMRTGVMNLIQMGQRTVQETTPYPQMSVIPQNQVLQSVNPTLQSIQPTVSTTQDNAIANFDRARQLNPISTIASGAGKALNVGLQTGLGILESGLRATTTPILLDPNKSWEEKKKFILAPLQQGEQTIAKSIAPGLATLSSALSFNRYQPDLNQFKDTFGSQAMEVAGTVGGNLATFAAIEGAVASTAKSIPSILAYTKQFPKTFRVLSQGLTWATHGQLTEDQEATVSQRATQFAKDFATGGLTGAFGEIAGPIKGVKGYAIGAGGSFAIGAGLSKIDGATDKDAITNGFIWAALHTMNKAFGEYKAPTQQQDSAIKTFNDLGKPFNITIDKTSTAEEVSTAYKNLSKIYHPDVLGTGDTLQATTLNTAKDLLLTKNGQLAQPNDETFGQELKRLYQTVKQGGTKKLPESTLENINTAVGNAIMNSPKNSEIDKALTYSPGKDQVLSQKFVDGILNDTAPQVNAYITDPKLKADIVKNIEPLRKGTYTNIRELVDAINEVLPMSTDAQTRHLIIGQPFAKSMGMLAPVEGHAYDGIIFSPGTQTKPAQTSTPTTTGEKLLSTPKPIIPLTQGEIKITSKEIDPLVQEANKTIPGKEVIQPITPQISNNTLSKNVTDTYLNTEHGANIEAILEMAEAGQRIFKKADIGSPEVTGVKSTFPDFLPENTRTRPVVDAVLKHLNNGTEPKEAQRRIYEAYHATAEQILGKEEYNKILEEQGIPLPEFQDTILVPQTPTRPAPGQPARVTKAASDINQSIIDQGYKALTPEEQAQYPVGSYKQDYKNVLDIVATDRSKAEAMATGRLPIEGVQYPQILYNEVKRLAKTENNFELQRDLAMSPLATQRSEAAGTLGSSGYNSDPTDPVAIAQEIMKIRNKGKEKQIKANTEAYNRESGKITRKPMDKTAKQITTDSAVTVSKLEKFIQNIKLC